MFVGYCWHGQINPTFPSWIESLKAIPENSLAFAAGADQWYRRTRNTTLTLIIIDTIKVYKYQHFSVSYVIASDNFPGIRLISFRNSEPQPKLEFYGQSLSLHRRPWTTPCPKSDVKLPRWPRASGRGVYTLLFLAGNGKCGLKWKNIILHSSTLVGDHPGILFVEIHNFVRYYEKGPSNVQRMLLFFFFSAVVLDPRGIEGCQWRQDREGEQCDQPGMMENLWYLEGFRLRTSQTTSFSGQPLPVGWSADACIFCNQCQLVLTKTLVTLSSQSWPARFFVVFFSSVNFSREHQPSWGPHLAAMSRHTAFWSRSCLSIPGHIASTACPGG